MPPEYLFRDNEGHELSETFHVEHAPSIGETIVRGEKVWTRVPAFGSVKGRRDLSMRTKQLPPWLVKAAGCRTVAAEDGQRDAVFTSKRELREFEAKSAALGCPFKHDEL